MRFAHHVDSHSATLIDQQLATDESLTSVLRVLIIEDSLIQLLSTFIQGSQLKQRGFYKWYRLTNFCDVEEEPAAVCVVVMFLAGGDTTRQQEVVKVLTKLYNGPTRNQIRVKLCFVPRRTCGQVSYFLLSVRHAVKNPALTWQEDDSGLILNKLKIQIADVPIILYHLDPTLTTLSSARSYKRVHLDGDLYPITSLLEGVKQLLSHATLTGVVSVIGIGDDGKLVSQKIVDYLATDFGKLMDDSSQGGVDARTGAPNGPAPAASQKPFGAAAVQALHDFADNMIQKTAAGEPKDRDTQSTAWLPTPEPERLPSEVLPDSILNGCIMQLSTSLDEDVKFVHEAVKESGLTRRSQQPSFKIRLPDEVKWPMPRVDGEKAEELHIKSIIVVDRAVDWVSPLLTPFTYEAMLDLEWGIESVNHLNLGKGHELADSIKLGDELYLRIRDLLLSDVGPALHVEALKMQSQAPSGSGSGGLPATGSVDEMHSALLKIKDYERAQRELGSHVGLVSHLVRNLWKNPAFFMLLKIEDDILNNTATSIEVHTEVLCQLAWRNTPVVDVIRLTMLVILVRGGNPSAPRVADVRSLVNLVQSVLHALASIHGLAVYQIWHELESMVFRNPNAVFPQVNSGQSSSSPFSFVHSGYTPLSVEILESVIKQVSHPACPATRVLKQKIKFAENANKEGDILLIFPHQVTFSELAAMRSLAASVSRKFVIVANSIGGYQSFIGKRETPYTEGLRSVVL